MTVPDDNPRSRRPDTGCAVCGGVRWSALPNPGPFCMASDWRVLGEPLDRCVCDTCGVAWRRPLAAGFFSSAYGLYAHAPGGAREAARQGLYARWIADHLTVVPDRVTDVGCGNGSLLLALRDIWPDAAMSGCDLSAESVAHGVAHGLRLWRGGLADQPAPLPQAGARHLIVSVNVIEHTANPLGFLGELRDGLDAAGTLVVVCPDGGRPGVELLMADHVHSLTPGHLRALMEQAGLQVTGSAAAPEALGAFQIMTARRGDRPAARVAPTAVTAECARRRHAYLHAWRELDGRLRDRVGSTAICFGVGETAGLLRAYAPSVWTSVTACTSDDAMASPFAEVPARRLADLSPDEQMLLAVRPADQPRVAARLAPLFRRIVTWYDLVNES